MKIIFEGTTGCGKTYAAIEAGKAQGAFIYAAPCRQLVYETAIKYGTRSDAILTGEVKINPKGVNAFCVYESLPGLIASGKFSTLIIDEAHFLADRWRGKNLYDAIKAFRGDIILCTATRNFETPKGFEVCALPVRQPFKIEMVASSAAYERMRAGVPTIIFRRLAADCGNLGGKPITADTPPHERMAAQLAFARGEIALIECTNVLAQGLNFPAQNVIIEVNFQDSDELIRQKIGRLGRSGITDESADLTFCFSGFPAESDLRRMGLYRRHDWMITRFESDPRTWPQTTTALTESTWGEESLCEGQEIILRWLKDEKPHVFQTLKDLPPHMVPMYSYKSEYRAGVYTPVTFDKYSVDTILRIPELFPHLSRWARKKLVEVCADRKALEAIIRQEIARKVA